MFNTDLLWFLLVPLFLSVGTVLGMRRLGVGFTWGQLVGSCAGGLVISALLLFGAFAAGKGMKTHDTEILNGQVTSKTREHGHYLESYECNCTTSTDSKGNTTRTCQTCYRDHYTVTWSCNSTIGRFRIDHLDRTSRSVYNAPDPARYTQIAKGDPVSRRSGYTNYIKAVPASLFRPAQAEVRAKFANMLPAYPDRVYDIYRINRVVGAGVSVPNAKAWNEAISNMLRTLGPSHEVNAVVVFAKTDDEDFFYALQDAWVNGKKNDVVVVVGVEDFNSKPLWVNVMALTKSNLFQVKLADRLRGLDSLTPDTVVGAMEDIIRTDFKRRPMAEFAYLDAEIDPPAWLMWLTMGFIVAAYAGFWFYVLRHRHVGSYSRYGIPRWSRHTSSSSYGRRARI